MFVVIAEDAAAIRAAFEHDGEAAAARGVRRRFRGIDDDATARDWARAIAGWQPAPERPPGTASPRRKD
jgi:hypothetical protein